MAENQNSLTLHLAGGGYEDLYPWDLVLEEGFSRLYRGELTVLSEKKHSMEELSGLLDKGISLGISQKLGDAKTGRTRYLHGIVTEVRSGGVFSNGKVKDCYSYVFVIEPELARLKYTNLTTPYYRMTPLDVFEAVLDKYRIKGRIEERYCSRRKYGKHLSFDQSRMSDFDLINVIASMYGISFIFTHPKNSDNALGVAELYFSDGEKFPLSPVVYSDKREEPASVLFDFLSADEGKSSWKMDAWTVSRAMGIDGFKLTSFYPNVNYGSEQWKWGKTERGDRYINQTSLFHNYDRDAEPAEVDRDIQLILDAQLLAGEQAKSLWTAGTGNLAFRPGLVKDLRHFYGMKDKDVMTALVTGSTLRHRTRWPAYLAVRMEGAGEERTELRGECIDWGGGVERRFCPLMTDLKR
jgi:hypothetical protein